MSSDNRAGQRRRTRLRSGKLADPDGAFLIECAVHDRSPEGARLRLTGEVAVPGQILLYEDDEHRLSAAAIVWRRGLEVGIRFTPEVRPPENAHRRLGGKFYAI